MGGQIFVLRGGRGRSKMFRIGDFLLIEGLLFVDVTLFLEEEKWTFMPELTNQWSFFWIDNQMS